MTQIKVARFQGPSKESPLKIGTAEKPTPGPKDVLVKVHACNVVPNTANMLTNTESLPEGFNIAMDPIAFGLDASGTIEAVGEHVLNLKVGDRVYVDPYLACDTCQACRRGRADLCPAGALRAYFALGAGEQGKKTLERYPLGGMSEYLLSPDANIVVLPDSVDLDTAARLGYIGTSFAALRKGGVGPASTVLINGVTGTLGYAAVDIALGFGATKILGVGRNPDRLKEVASLGKNIVVTSSEEESDMAAWVKKNTNGLGPDVLIDCLGVGGKADTTMNLIRSVKRGGKAILVAGGAEGEVSQTYIEAMMHEVAIIGSTWFRTGDIDDLVAMMDAGLIDFSFLQHKSFGLDEANEAIKFVGDRPGGAVNVLVKPSN